MTGDVKISMETLESHRTILLKISLDTVPHVENMAQDHDFFV